MRHSSSPFITHRACYADTDAGGVVYHGRYIEMVERARNMLMYEAGYSFARLAREHEVMLIVHKVLADYHAPALLEDELLLFPWLSVCRPSRSTWVTEVRRADTPIATITMDMVALHTGTRRLARLPDPFVQALQPFVRSAVSSLT